MSMFRIFDVVFSLTGGGPYNATETISLYAYKQGFASFNLGFASIGICEHALHDRASRLRVAHVARRDRAALADTLGRLDEHLLATDHRVGDVVGVVTHRRAAHHAHARARLGGAGSGDVVGRCHAGYAFGDG